LRLFKEHLGRNYDYIYLHEEPHSILSFVFSLLKKKSNIIIDAAIINTKINFKGLNVFEQFVYKKADYIFYRNHQVRNVLLKRGAKEQSLAGEIGNGVSARVFHTDQKRLNQKFTLGFAGRIWEWKGLEILVEIAKTRPEIEVKVCGPVVDRWLENKLKDAGVLVYPKLNGSQLCQFYQSLDLFILPSLDAPGWSEQFGRVIIESVFSGTPAIGSTTGFIPELVGEGAVFQAGSISNLNDLIDLYMDKSAREELYSRQFNFMSKYSWDGVAEQLTQGLRVRRCT
jgi:glycosyltransferase involved in cell wall biosynthesis